MLPLVVATLVVLVTAHPGGAEGSAYRQVSPDRRWELIFSRHNGYGRLDLVERSTGRRFRMYRSNDACCDQITWVAPHTLVFVDDYRVKTLDPSTRRVEQIAGFSDFVVSANGAWVAGYADTGGHAAESVYVVPLAGGECLRIPKKPDQDDADPAFSAESKVVYVERRHFSSQLGADVGPTRRLGFRLSTLQAVSRC